MSYCFSVSEQKFHMTKDKIPLALERLERLFSSPNVALQDEYDCDKVLEAAKRRDFTDTMEALKWEINVDLFTGDIIELKPIEPYLGEEDQIFDAIAPAVDAGSYILARGEKDDSWLWYFNEEGVCEVLDGTTVYKQHTPVWVIFKKDVLTAESEKQIVGLTFTEAEAKRFVEENETGSELFIEETRILQ